MPLTGEYEPSSQQWVRDQVALYESSGGREGTTLLDTGMPVVIVTNRGVHSGKLRKTPLMRVEFDGIYAIVASQGGAPAHPAWYTNLVADPHVELQDGPDRSDRIAREVFTDEREPGGSGPWRPTRPMPSTRRRPNGSSRSWCSSRPGAEPAGRRPGGRDGPAVARVQAGLRARKASR